MVAFILSLLWRHIASVREGVRVLNEEGLLWTGAMSVSPQAVLQRLRELPPDLFANILDQVLPLMQERWKSRHAPSPRHSPGRPSIFPRSWRWMARPWTRFPRKSVCFKAGSAMCWRDGWPPY